MKPPLLGFLVAFAVFVIDQASKSWMIHGFELGSKGTIALLPILDLVLAWNKGVSYSLFRSDGDTGRWILIGLAFVALAVLAVWLTRTRSRLTAVALGLVAGGAAGNVIDRLIYGAVADFLYFHTPIPLGPISNYVFNLADVGIVAGVVCLLYESLVPRSGAGASQPQG